MKAFNPVTISFHNVNCSRYGNISFSSYYEKSTAWKNKLVAVGTECENAKQIISAETTLYIQSYKSPVIYIAPECKMSRDLFRKSGFKITYNRDNCSTIVIPALLPEDIYESRYNICIVAHNTTTNKSHMSLYSVEGCNNVDGQPVFPNQIEPVVSACKKHVEGFGFTIDETLTDSESSLKNITITSLPKCDEYFYILNNLEEKLEDKEFCFDTDVKVTPSVEINLDTLLIWKDVGTEVLAKVIPSSNWKDYPMTVALFLNEYKSSIRYQCSGNFREVLSEIGFTELNDRGTCNKLVQPNDWKLWTEFVLSQYGLGPNGGFTSKLQMRQISGVRCKVAMAPFVITEPMTYDNIIATIKAKK